MDEIEKLKRLLESEQKARLECQRLLEEKNLENLEVKKELLHLQSTLDKEIDKRILLVKHSERQLRILFESHPLPMMVYRLSDEKFVAVNKTAILKYGYTIEEFLLMKIEDLHPENEKQSVQEDIKNVRKGIISDKEWKHISKDGKIYDVLVSANHIDYDNQECRLVLILDVSESKKASEEISESERKYRELVELLSDIIYRANALGEFIYVNPIATKICEYSEKELLGKHFTDLICDDYKEKVASFYRNQLEKLIRSTYFEFPILTKTGKEVWVGQTVDLHRNRNGSIEFIALARNITDRIAYQTALTRSEEKYRSIIENLELGLLEVDNNDIIVKAYPKFCLLSGYNEGELEGKKASETLLPIEFIELMAMQREKRNKGEPDVYEVQIIKKDGSRLWVIISGAPFYSNNNEVIGSVGIHLDISGRKKMEEELIKAIHLSEQSVRSKELFMANMSHEIRTPMNAIIGMSDLLGKTILSPQQEKYNNAVQTSAQNLLVIVNDILDFSKLESGNLSLENIPINLFDLIEGALNSVLISASEKGINLLCKIDNNLPEIVLGDPVRLNQIFLNLLSNAIKFTPEGSVSIYAKLNSLRNEIVTILFEVIDTGIGIPEDKKDLIFESFVQADESVTRKYGGTGLGLAICKSLVGMMGGELKLCSNIKSGSKFYFELEFTIPKETVQLIEKPNYDTEYSLDGLNVLLVEDHEINRFMAQTILKEWGCIVTCAVNGIEAFQMVEKNNFDIVLMDMRMPEMDGIEATIKIRNELLSKVPIIALTANAIQGDSDLCLSVGMNDYVSKPFNRMDLRNKIIELTKNRIMELENKEEKEKKYSDISKLEQAVSGDKAFLQMMINMFVEDTPNQIDLINVHLNNKNYKDIKHIVHKLKPSIGYLAQKEIFEQCKTIELELENHNFINDGLLFDFQKSLHLLIGELKEYLNN